MYGQVLRLKWYETTLGKVTTASIIIAVIVISGFLALSIFRPTDQTGVPDGTQEGLGARAAEYINSRRDDVVFYWMCNSSFVNERLTQHYQETAPDAFVDGVKMSRHAGTSTIDVLFAPYTADITGHGEISPDEWDILSGSLVDDAIAQMPDATEHPADFPSTWPIDFYVSIFFDDNTFFYIGYTESDQMVFLQNGTWTGQFTEYDHPEITGFAETGYWLNANGLMTTPIDDFYQAITENVVYPE